MIVKEVMKSLKRMNNVSQFKLHQVAKGHDLTIEQLFLLIQLTEEYTDVGFSKSATVGELAFDFSITPHTLSERIKRLEKRELIRKIKDEKDSRINRIFLTENGELLINKINSETGDIILENAIKDVDPEILHGFLLGLNEINKNVCKNN